MGELIAVLSGKGGTGKTSVCAGLATALSQMGKKVLCIDCDVGLRNLDIALGIPEIGALSFLDICSGDYTRSYELLRDYSDLGLSKVPETKAAQLAYEALHESFSYELSGELSV